MGQTLKDVLKAAQRAVQFDKNKQYKQAVYYYEIVTHYLQKSPADSEYFKKAKEYEDRILELHKIILEDEGKKHKAQSTQESQHQRCKFLLNHALDADAAGLKDEAIKLYTDAAEIGLSIKSLDAETKAKVHNLVKEAIERAEALKSAKTANVSENQDDLPELPSVPDINLPDLPVDDIADSNAPAPSPTTSSGTLNKASPSNGSKRMVTKRHNASGNYSEDEKKVLLLTSHINDHEFVPFMNVDLREKFQYAITFSDKDGLLKLSPKQKVAFSHWARPDEIFSSPTMNISNEVDYHSIKQTVVSDCSFVASLAVCAQFDRKFGQRLVTSIIYPKNSSKQPIYNPFGKYMVKLHINGILRKVIIDDLLPVNRHNQLLCSYSNNNGELWVSLLEKAYMKVMGGYDFPGSNSNIDLHALTGWLPERWAIRPNDADFNKDGLFNILHDKLHLGHILVTVATGELSDSDADRTGLVSTHAYAVLDVRKINNERLLQLKNPWSNLRWRGNFSELDLEHWTPELRNTLNYDPDSASQFDNGIFWIDYDSICHFFDVFYLNWNPALFDYTYCTHQMWRARSGPVKDTYSVGENPQFSLHFQQNVSGAIWILLTRHITDIADFRQNKEYITLLVYRNNGKRVYYPYDPAPYIDGVRINSPHYLCKIKLGENNETSYTLVISQYEKTSTIFYTLRVYSTCPFSLRKVSDPYKHEIKITDGSWNESSAGGCRNHPTFMNNPKYQLILESSSNNNHLLVELRAPKQFLIGFDVINTNSDEDSSQNTFKNKNSGSFRSGFVYLELEDVPAGKYEIIPSTFYPGQEGPFFLTCKASCSISLERI